MSSSTLSPRRLTLASLIVMASLLLSACAGQSMPTVKAVITSPAAVGPAGLQLGQAVFAGTVTAVDGKTVKVNGVTFQLDQLTSFDNSVRVGSQVKVLAMMLPDQTRLALSVTPDGTVAASLKTSGAASSPAVSPSAKSEDMEYEFYGKVESMDGGSWVISGQPVSVPDTASVDQGIVVGSLVEVKGVMVNGVLVASEIQLEDHQGEDENSTETQDSEDDEHTGDQNLTETPQPEDHQGEDENLTATPQAEDDHSGDQHLTATPEPGGDQHDGQSTSVPDDHGGDSGDDSIRR